MSHTSAVVTVTLRFEKNTAIERLDNFLFEKLDQAHEHLSARGDLEKNLKIHGSPSPGKITFNAQDDKCNENNKNKTGLFKTYSKIAKRTCLETGFLFL